MIQNIEHIPEQSRNPVWFNGKLIPFEEAAIHVITHSNNYGTAVFEGIRVYDTVKGTSIFHLSKHIDRFLASAKKMHIQHSYTKEEIMQACMDTVAASNQSRGYIRPQLQFGFSGPGLGKIDVVEMSIFFWPLGNYRTNDALKLILSDIERISPKAGDIEAKVMGFYTNSHFNYQFAKQNQADDAVMLDRNGNVSEVSSANIFLVKDKEIITPQTGYILKGITRASVIEIAERELELKVTERIVTPDELRSADEIFLTGTAAEIDIVTAFENHQLQSASDNAIAKQLKAFYSAITSAEKDAYSSWHAFVK